MEPIHIIVAARLSNLPQVTDAITRACRLVGGRSPVEELGDNSSHHLEDPFDAEVVSACSELFTNAVRHSYGGGCDAHVEFEVEAHSNRIVIRITDHGEPFDLAQIAEPELKLLPEHGMGLYIVRAFLDRAEYEPGPPNRWTLEKGYPSSSTVR